MNKIKVTVKWKWLDNIFIPSTEDVYLTIICDEDSFSDIIHEFGRRDVEKVIIEEYHE